MSRLPIQVGTASLRAWRTEDRSALVAAANDREVWRNMSHLFPHPYTGADADWWIERCMGQDPPLDLVIAINDELVGVGAITSPGEGVAQYSARVGYWLARAYQGRGIGTAVCGALVSYAWEVLDVERLQAEVFAWNPASARVLEKNGFVLEGRRRRAIFKDGEFVDELIYSTLRSEAT